MQKNINSNLIKTAFLLFLLWYPIYIARNNFNRELFVKFWESVLEYKYRILLVILTNLLIVLWESLPFKKPKKLELFFLRRKPIITIIMFIYPFFPDFQHRFWKISENNVTDFYAIFLPIFIMFIITSLMKTGDPIFLKEMKDTLNVKSETSHKTNSLVIKTSLFTIILAYCFLFFILTFRISCINKVNYWYKDNFILYPCMVFIFFLGVSWFFYTIIDNKPSIKNNSNKIKNNVKSKDSHKDIKVNFK